MIFMSALNRDPWYKGSPLCSTIAPSGQSTPEPRNEKEAVEGLELKGHLAVLLENIGRNPLRTIDPCVSNVLLEKQRERPVGQKRPPQLLVAPANLAVTEVDPIARLTRTRPNVERLISGKHSDPNRTLARHHFNNILAQEVLVHFKVAVSLWGVNVLLQGHLVEIIPV